MINTAPNLLRRNQWLGNPSYWLAQGLGWGSFVAAEIASIIIFSASFPAEALLESVAVTLTGILSTHFLRIACIQIRRKPLSWPQTILRLIPAWILTSNFFAGTLHFARITWVNREQLAAIPDYQTGPLYNYISLLSRCSFFVIAWLGLYFGIQYYRDFQKSTIKRLQLEKSLREAELQALKAQLNPHFLFNSLNTIRALIPIDLAKPRQAVTSLSELLRASLRHGKSELIPLSEELEVVENYLSLEQLRHEHRLTIDQDLSPLGTSFLVPPFSLQGLVENAMHHGIAQFKEGGTLRIQSYLENGLLILQVENPGNTEPNHRSTGIGLTNLRAQLKLLYSEQAQLTLVQTERNTVLATLSLPALTHET